MARPRIIEVGTGKITLNGFSPEEADKLEDLLMGRSQMPQNTSGTAMTFTTTEALKNIAVGLSERSDKTFEVVTVKYGDGEAARVINREEAGSFRNAAQHKFRTTVLSHKLIKP